MVAIARHYTWVSTRALAAWRIALGFVACGNTLYFWPEFDVFYLNEGVFPPSPASDLWSPLFTTSEGTVHLILGAAVFCSLLFAAGVRGSKWVLPFLLASIYQRAPLVETGGHAVVQLSLVYSWLLPVERDWSIERYFHKRTVNVPPLTVSSWAYPLVLLQLAVNYGFNTFNKLNTVWAEGVALERALLNPSTSKMLGSLLTQAPDWLLTGLTYGGLFTEGILPILLLSPFRRREAHRVAATLMLLLHGSILLTLEVGYFSAAMLAQIPLLAFTLPHVAPQRLRSSAPSIYISRFATLGLLYIMVFSLGRRDNSAGVNRGAFSHDLLPLPGPLYTAMHWLNLHQGWGMFARPVERSFVNVVRAQTASGRIFDPWRFRAADERTPITSLPRAAYPRHMYAGFETNLYDNQELLMAFSRWIFRQAPYDQPAEKPLRHAVFTLSVPTEKRYQFTTPEIMKVNGVHALPLVGALPVKTTAFGVWAPTRATDGLIVHEHGHVFSPTGSSFAPGCAYLMLDLGTTCSLRAAYLQTDSIDEFLLEGSRDGKKFHHIGTSLRLRGRQYQSRLINLQASDIRWVRVRPRSPRRRRGFLSEIALFNEPQQMPPLTYLSDSPFVANYRRPGAMGLVSANGPSPQSDVCPWESDLRR